MSSMNKAILIGNLGQDAEVRFTNNGDPVATLSLATTEKWNDKGGGKKERTEWHRIVVWGKMAESLQQYLTKGKQIAVEGQIQYRKWQDKDGNDKYTTEIRASQITLLGGGESRSDSGGRGRSGSSGGRNSRDDRDDDRGGEDDGFKPPF